jgi:hypothetical protein
MSPKSKGDNRFKITISGDVDKYVPEKDYTVSLKGERILHTPQKFTGFMLVVEPSSDFLPSWVDEYQRGMMDPVSDYSTRNVGVFTLFGYTETTFSDRCPNAIVQTSSIPKSEIQVLWKAPPKGSGCVVFRATVVENRDTWYMDDGQLSHLLCEDVEDNDKQPEVVNSCCACNEAKYEVTFESLWSRHTHPKDFPSNGTATRFSDVIGASHSADYQFWKCSNFASDGLRQVAESGATRMLETELKNQSEHIRTIIKARGISHSNVTGKTFAVFRVDRKHHLMSIVSKIDPSPDWIVGVSRLELCLRNCSWVEHRFLNLYPYDAGTDSGITYLSPDMPTRPPETIQEITSSYPNDTRSPFFGMELKPLARVYLTRQRLYEKSCLDESVEGSSEDDSGFEDSTASGDCAVTEWGPWSPCTVTCGRGVKYKQRSYVDTMKSQIRSCDVKLTLKYHCQGAHETCSSHIGNEVTGPPLDPMCTLTKWTVWSSCTVTCGRGVRTRTRSYERPEVYKRCSPHRDTPHLQQNDVCNGEGGDRCDVFPEESKDRKLNCPMTEWSRWTPCSATCGKGRRMRTRLQVAYNEETKKMYEHMEESYIGPLSMEDCLDVQVIDEVECDGEFPSCEISPSMAREICQMPKYEGSGSCTGNNSRWYFDPQVEACLEFLYSGCRGNRNNFETQDRCESACKKYKEEEDEDADVTTTASSALQAESHVLENNASTDEAAVDCVVSRWSPWSFCSVSCGRGIKTKTRTIQVHARNGGKPCPKKMLKKKKCKVTCGKVEPVDCSLSEWTSWSPCTLTCGSRSVRQRTRSVVVTNSGGGLPCGSRLEVQTCEELTCN